MRSHPFSSLPWKKLFLRWNSNCIFTFYTPNIKSFLVESIFRNLILQTLHPDQFRIFNSIQYYDVIRKECVASYKSFIGFIVRDWIVVLSSKPYFKFWKFGWGSAKSPLSLWNLSLVYCKTHNFVNNAWKMFIRCFIMISWKDFWIVDLLSDNKITFWHTINRYTVLGEKVLEIVDDYVICWMKGGQQSSSALYFSQ